MPAQAGIQLFCSDHFAKLDSRWSLFSDRASRGPELQLQTTHLANLIQAIELAVKIGGWQSLQRKQKPTVPQTGLRHGAHSFYEPRRLHFLTRGCRCKSRT